MIQVLHNLDEKIIKYVLKMQDAEVLATQSNEILTAIVHGMKREEPSNHVRLAATTALLNSLEFTKANFDKEVCILLFEYLRLLLLIAF